MSLADFLHILMRAKYWMNFKFSFHVFSSFCLVKIVCNFQFWLLPLEVGSNYWFRMPRDVSFLHNKWQKVFWESWNQINGVIVQCWKSRVVFKLVWDFSVAPYKPSDSAQKFDGPLNLASHEREVRWWIGNPSSIIVFVFCLVTQPLWLVRPDLEVHQISAQNHSVCTELRKSLVLIWKRL